MDLATDDKTNLIAALQQTHFFDPVWYLLVKSDVRAAKIDAVAHFTDYGLAEMRNPHPLFSTGHYLEQH